MGVPLPVYSRNKGIGGVVRRSGSVVRCLLTFVNNYCFVVFPGWNIVSFFRVIFFNFEFLLFNHFLFW